MGSRLVLRKGRGLNLSIIEKPVRWTSSSGRWRIRPCGRESPDGARFPCARPWEIAGV